MTNQLIETLENQHKEMGLLIQQLRKANITIEDVKEHFGVATDVIVFEGQKYRKVDRLAREGDVAVINRNDGNLGSWWTTGKPYKVYKDIKRVYLIADDGDDLIVYSEHHGRKPEVIDVYEPIGEDKPKTPNQLRAEIIEKAKWFVEKYLTHSKHGYGIVADNLTPLTTRTGPIKYKFVVNVEKRTIVAIGSLLHVGSIDDNYKGIAKCMPGDVFNEHIGKAIALGRALGLDVSEFENAVQPNEIVVGMQIKYKSEKSTVTVVEDGIRWIDTSSQTSYSVATKEFLYPTIINDTNAQYGGNA